jgi:glutamate dehydrogenase
MSSVQKKIYNFKQFDTAFRASLSTDDIKHITKTLLDSAITWQFDLFQKRSSFSKIDIHVLNVTKKQNGWEHPRTIISIICPDMAFIVDSIIACLSDHGHLIESSVHPTIYADEKKIYTDSKNSIHPTAFFFIELTRRLTPAQIQKLQGDITKVMQDVRDGTKNWLDIKKSVSLAKQGIEHTPHISQDDLNEYSDFISYIHDDNFTLLGCVSFTQNSKRKLVVHSESGLGFLSKSRQNEFLTDDDLHFIETAFETLNAPVIISKSSIKSTVHRRVPLDLVLIKQFDKNGKTIGLFILLGLFTSVTYSRSLRGIPFLRQKSKKIIARAEFGDNSHDARALRHIIEKYPRDELFQMDDGKLYKACIAIMKLQERPRIALLLRNDLTSRYMTSLIYVPRDRFDTRLRLRFQKILEQELNVSAVNFTVTIDDSHLVRVLFALKPQGDIGTLTANFVTKIEDKLQIAGRSWAETLQDALSRKLKDDDQIAQTVQWYGDAFPISYQESYSADQTVQDIQKLDLVIRSESIATDFQLTNETNRQFSLKIYAPKQPLILSDILPILENMGLKVLAEYPFEVHPSHNGIIWIQDIHVQASNQSAVIDFEKTKSLFEDCLTSVWNQTIENDRLNQLVLFSAVDARRVSIVRCYVRYARQSKMPYSLSYIEQAVTDHPKIAKLLIDLFEEKFSPQTHSIKRADVTKNKILSELQTVKSIDQDRILRSILGIVDATLRTNFYQDKIYISIKLDPSKTPELPEPKPYREMFVYAPHVEGVHLRGDKVARGGLRWSDRHEDFRTEVLGLMKAQQVKNSVIVPMGAKGGFVVKNPPTTGGREAYQAEGIRCYQTFIRGLLDITDNQKGNKIIPPKNVVRLDGDDPYLVVAADKGTATFSDIANSISLEYGFWLGDAFASGGSAGYDHKKMGITARGSWESVKRHFREIGINTQTQEFTAIGVGDMGGDVFGNGMLQSEHTQLLAAFNHLHIFIDPTPDTKLSFKERARLFKTVKGWDQYNTKLLSKGGRIYNRSDKVLKLTPEIQKTFGIESPEISPNDLIQILLKAKVDLLYFGGIGTYIKAVAETHQDVGDRSNDTLRINADEVRASVIGEGANLAITQRARIEYSLNGGRINTDFIDNSAGVDTSDHEVNIKILLAATNLSNKSRNELLEKMTDDVAALVLRDNYQQTQALSLMQLQSHETLLNDSAFMNSLQRDGLLNKKIEFLPTEQQILERYKNGLGLTRPELSIILSYAKIVFTKELVNTNIPDQLDMQDWAIHYFPRALQDKYRKEILGHKLYRDIVATMISNAIINRMGPTFVRLAMEQTGCNAADVTRAFMTVRDAFGLRPLWDKVEALDNKVPAMAQLKALRKISRLAQRETTWFLTKLGRAVKRAEDGKIYGTGIQTIRDNIEKILPADTLSVIKEQQEAWVNDGLPKSVAHEIALFKILGSAPDIIHITQQYKSDLMTTSKLYFAIGSLFNFDWLRTEAKKLHGENEWSRAVIASVLDGLYAAQANLTIDVLKMTMPLKSSNGKSKPQSLQANILDKWVNTHAKIIHDITSTITHVKENNLVDVSVLLVLEQKFRILVK